MKPEDIRRNFENRDTDPYLTDWFGRKYDNQVNEVNRWDERYTALVSKRNKTKQEEAEVWDAFTQWKIEQGKLDTLKTVITLLKSKGVIAR